jgi:hypothetical protein
VIISTSTIENRAEGIRKDRCGDGRWEGVYFVSLGSENHTPCNPGTGINCSMRGGRKTESELQRTSFSSQKVNLHMKLPLLTSSSRHMQSQRKCPVITSTQPHDQVPFHGQQIGSIEDRHWTRRRSRSCLVHSCQ